MPIVPNTPIGSRTKILISTHVRRQSPLSMIAGPRHGAPSALARVTRHFRHTSVGILSVPDRMAGQPEEDVLERRDHGAEVGDPDAMLREALDHLR